MQYNVERRRRENIRRKRRRARQIRRCVCLVACIIAGMIAVAARTSTGATDFNNTCAQIEAGPAAIAAFSAKNAVPILQIENEQDEAAAAVPREPVFVCLPVPMSEEEQRIVFDICKDNGVAFSFVMAIIGEESEFNKEARSKTGDSGYMQINDCNAEELARRGYTDLYDTTQNVGAGVSILRDLFNKYGEDEAHRVLMAYNMGERRAAELWAQGIETSEYSREIVEREAEYSRYMDKYLERKRDK